MEILGETCDKCGVEWGKHHPHLVPLEENFKIKNVCGWCGEQLEGTWQWYRIYGNSCKKCHHIGSKY